MATVHQAPKKLYLLQAPQAGWWASWDWPGVLGKAGKGLPPHWLPLLLCFRVDKSFTPRRSVW